MIMSRSLNMTTTENTLTVYNVTSSDVGVYICAATNTLGNDTENGKKIFELLIMYIISLLLYCGNYVCEQYYDVAMYSILVDKDLLCLYMHLALILIVIVFL